MLIINLKNHLVQLTKTLTSVTTLLVCNFQGANSKEGGTCLPQKVKKILLLSFLCIQYSEQIFLLICQEKPPTLKLDCNLILMKVLIFHCLFLQYASSYHWKKKSAIKEIPLWVLTVCTLEIMSTSELWCSADWWALSVPMLNSGMSFSVATEISIF